MQQRKNELQSLYGGEMSHWKETLKSSLEVTPEERMERIRTRAYDLNAKREAERKEFAEECYERQCRDACDDLRAFDSKATLDRIVKDRESMIEIRRITAEENASSQNDVDVMSLISRDESDEQSQRRRSNLEFKRALDHQVQWKNTRDESTTKQKQQEEQEQLQNLALLERQTRESAREKGERNRMRGRDMLHETRLRVRDEEEKEERQRTENRILLRHALDEERRQCIASPSREN